MDLKSKLEELVRDFRRDLENVSSVDSLEALRVAFMGRKGKLARLMAQLPALKPEERPDAGKFANSVKEELASLFNNRLEFLEKDKSPFLLQHFDPSMPGRQFWNGSLHPVTIIMEEVCGVFKNLGFDVADGPEVEIDRYNFEALNIPPEHPARDMQDTLYINDNVLLRTHTSPVQIRTMLAHKPPVAVVAPGKVYRRDSDLTHTPMFHQIEGLSVDYGITMANLRGVLTAFVRAIFGKDTKTRFRPSFFPFTEPSAEVDISCCICGGAGEVHGEPCRVCKSTGWVEILGCGMVDPAVYTSVGYEPGLSGFAFGLGLERIAMLKFGIPDLRMFFENDMRFLAQFGQYA